MNIKKLAAAMTIAIAASFPVTAQEQYLHLYKDGSVTKSYKVSSIDSMLLDDTNCNIDLYRNGIRHRAGSYASIEKMEIGGALMPSGIYMGVIGFAEKLSVKGIESLSTANKSSFTGFVNGLNLSTKIGTLLYHAVDEGLDAIKAAELPSDLVNVSVVTFTDGLDQGSSIEKPQYETNEAWTTALSSRIGTEKVGGISITTYTIGLKGGDVTDATQFRKNLQSLSSSADNAIEISDISELNANFERIADNIYSESSSHTVSLTMPGQSNGRRVRFTFDNVSSATGSSMYIEGTFRLSDYSLTDVSYCGLSCMSGTTVKGERNGIEITYTFDEVKSLTATEVKADYIKHWYYIADASLWQGNSEFTPENNTEIEVHRKSAVIMLVLDCSGSLGSQFSTVKTQANNFIGKLAGYGNSEGFSYTDLDEMKILENMQYTDMVPVKGSTFWMGAQSTSSGSRNYDSEADSDESPVHQVTLGDYYIGKYEVTQQLWEYVMNYSGVCADGTTMSAYSSDPWLGSNPSTSYGKGNYYPAYYVSHDDIVNVFLPRLNRITGREYSLPTEAEWEYAARGGSKSKGYKYSGSDNIGDVAWYYSNSSSTTHAVGTKQPNELGIYDMSGNVWEWCQDWYGSYTSSSQTNPTGPANGSFRVFRGGYWGNYAQACRVSSRNGGYPDYRYFSIGFRLVLRSL